MSVTKVVTIESRRGQQIEFVVECSYNQPSIGGNYGSEFERLGDDYEIDKIYRNDIDVTKRISRLCKRLFELVTEKINQE